jgi:hypothetical protein
LAYKFCIYTFNCQSGWEPFIYPLGLGLHNVKVRASAMLIHTFLAQAVSPRFPTNHYYSTLYRWHVLDQHDFLEPVRPPYYSAAFFSTIKHVHNNTPLNVAWVSVKQWYQLLLEHGVTHTSDDEDSPPVLFESRFEETNQGVDFLTSYRLSRLFGLAPEQKSFLFKLLQCLLPTKERLNRMGKVPSPSCTFCQDQVDNLKHLITCHSSAEVTSPLLHCLTSQDSTTTPGDVIRLNIHTTESMELPVIWLISTCLMYAWEERVAGRKARLDKCRAELQARAALLRCTKWKHYSLHNSVVLLDELINLHFC